jgi:cytochrome c biogenesis protein CcmG, thiol:disulfide interchange protein DsbE
MEEMAKVKKSPPVGEAAPAIPDRGVNRNYWIGIALSVVAMCYIFADSLSEKIVNQGDQATAFTVTANDGKQYSVKDFHGKVLVLNFWASWCKPCVDEMPSLNRFASEMKKNGVTVLGISVDHDEAKYKKFLKAANIGFPVFHDPKAEISSSYGTYKYPETYIIDKSGKVVEKIIGEKMWLDPEVIANVKRYL